MLCDKCHSKEAVINYIEIAGGVKRQIHLCEDCAAEMTGMRSNLTSLGHASFLANLLASVLGMRDDGGMDSESLRKTNIVCPSCGMTYNEFLKIGTFGCPDCYKTYNFLLDSYLKKIQGNCEHSGKYPFYSGETVHVGQAKTDEEGSGSGSAGQDIAIMVDEDSAEAELQVALQRAVAREEYEEAARIRDIIRAMKEKKKHDEMV
jgi:protein arginine kinase activator